MNSELKPTELKPTELKPTELKPTELKPTETETEKYLNSLTEIEKLAMEIAKQHLGTSFDISKSNGFLKSS